MNPKKAAHTGSSENASAVRVALVRRCAQVCDEERERAREHARDDQRAPDRPAVRHASCPRASATTSSPANAAEHLDQRERERVVARREALHQHDLERVDGRAGRARAGRRRASRRATPESSASPTVASATPSQAAARRAGRGRAQREHRCQHDVHPGDEPGRGDSRSLEAGRLQDVPGAEQRARQSSGCRAGAAERAYARRARHGERRASRSRNAPRGTRIADR